MDRCKKCGIVLSASADSGTMCAKCLKEIQDAFLQAAQNPAFPVVCNTGASYGLSKREWFAGMAMMGICSNPTTSDTAKNIAVASYILADEMIKQGAET